MSELQISVVIPSYQRRAVLQRALQALARQTLVPSLYEVIVVVDGSEDGTREMLAQFLAPYKLRSIWQTNRGRATACNTGIRAATGNIIVLLDDDMEGAPGLLEAHLRLHQSKQCLGVLGAVPVAIDQPSTSVVKYVSAKYEQYHERMSQIGYKLTIGDFYTGNFSIRRSVLLDVGLFDETFTIYGNEDLDLLIRLLKVGIELVYNPDALAHQHYLKNFTGLAQDTMAEGQTAVQLARKHPEAFSHLRLVTYKQASYQLRLLRALLLAIGRHWRGMPQKIILLIETLEQRCPIKLHWCYGIALDYFYWLGAQAALTEQRCAGNGLRSFACKVESLSTPQTHQGES